MIPQKIGIIGGGQLAKMLAQAAQKLGFTAVIVDPDPTCPARAVTPHYLDDITQLPDSVDIVTLENEFIDSHLLDALELPIYPTPDTMSLIQDKYHQKEHLAKAGLPVAAFQDLKTQQDILDFAKTHAFPLILKARRNGYDGKGNCTIHTPEDIPVAWQALDGDNNPLYIEAFCPFEREIATIITRTKDGKIATYPIVDTLQKDHICHRVTAPSTLSKFLQDKAKKIAQNAITQVGGIGSMGVEMFVTKEGDILINELAPRVHNTGHYTIEACHCSQFENHIRAITGLPLGSPNLITPAAAMVNLIAQTDGVGDPTGKDKIDPAVSLHLYGKIQARSGRKMGHVTVVGSDLTNCITQAETAANHIKFGGKS